MTMHFSILDEQTFSTIKKSEKEIENLLDCDLIGFYGEITPDARGLFIRLIEEVIGKKQGKKQGKKSTLAISLHTPGGSVEDVEVMVRVIREHYKNVYFIVAHQAMSAGTIFCMSGDKIYMDYTSSLGPIDPQIVNKEGRFVPALGYLDKVNELVQKSANGQITPSEYAIIANQDLAFLHLCEQARELSMTLLKEWLVEYKFKNWKIHRTNNKGNPVTKKEKEQRAQKIAEMLSDNNIWHTHGRFIGLEKLRKSVRLEIDDFSKDEKLRNHIRIYSDMFYNYYAIRNVRFALYNSIML